MLALRDGPCFVSFHDDQVKSSGMISQLRCGVEMRGGSLQPCRARDSCVPGMTKSPRKVWGGRRERWLDMLVVGRTMKVGLSSESWIEMDKINIYGMYNDLF